MSTISPVTLNTPVTSIVRSPQGDVQATSLAVLLVRYMSLKADMEVQLGELDRANKTKRLWNDKLMQLNRLMNEVAATGETTGKLVEVFVSPEDLPYKEYKLTTLPDGTLTLEPTSLADDNLVGKATPVFGTPGRDPKELAALDAKIAVLAATLKPSLPLADANRINAELSALLAERGKIGADIVGYRIEVSATMVQTQIENVRTQIDNLNTFNDIGLLRLNDTHAKANLTIENFADLSKGNNRTLDDILDNW